MLAVIPAVDENDLSAAFAIRRKVFCEEQGVAIDADLDGLDADATHLLALWNDAPVGTLRWRILEGSGEAKVERVAVLPAERHRGIGQALMRAALDAIARKAPRAIRLNAQTHVVGFYEVLGFCPEGPVFEEEGIPHRRMRLPLP
ncbi:MAG: GNAT family N-acetyltransferase [Geminicoccaceae bacterium]|nr:GNAT family N-acetyltransferase [Geminicoccaceae bacterium]